MAAIMIRDLGHEVHVLERSAPEELQSQAAGMQAGLEVEAFVKRYIKEPGNYGIFANSVDVLSKEGEVVKCIPMSVPMRLVTWYALYRLCLGILLDAIPGKRSATYETHRHVTDIRDEGDSMTVVYRDLEAQREKVMRVELVIGADGANSMVKKKLLQEVSPRYAGYVTWRGRLPEKNASQETLIRLREKCTIHRVEDGYFVM